MICAAATLKCRARNGQYAHVDDFFERQNRLASTPLSPDEVSSLPDDELDDRIWLRLGETVGDGDAASVATLPELLRAYYATRVFEWEVMNGGLHQFFFNYPEPRMLELVLEGYRSLGLDGAAATVREVVEPIAQREAEWREALRDGRIETFMESYVETALPEYDDRIEIHDADRLAVARRDPSRFAI